jgi:glucose-1-phosphate thymidylyltransferase
MKGLILAGGHGTRLRPLTFTGNKHMIPVANQPILFYGLRHLATAGIRDVAVILGPIEEGIREQVGDGREFGLNVQYIVQGDPKGLAHAVLCAREYLGREPFLMYLGDNLLQSGVSQFIDRFHSVNPDAVVGATPVSRPQAYGIVELSGEKIVSIEEKPANPRSNLALIGVYLFSEAIHPIVANLSPSKRVELEITDAIWRLQEARGRVSVLTVSGWWKDTGRPEDLLEANELILRSLPREAFRVEGVVQAGAMIEGPVTVGAGSIIEANATIVGPSILGPEVRVGRGSHIGPYCAIGRGAVINHTWIRRSIVMERSWLDGVRIADSLVGRNVEVKSGTDMDRELKLTLGDSSRIVI